MTQYVYTFGEGKAQGKSSMKELLGGKGAGLAEMSLLGLPVPPGFTITTQVCTHYLKNDRQFPVSLKDEVLRGLAHIENILGRGFGNASNPLLVSVRSGARASMPGMMETILNVGLNDNTVQGLAQNSENEFFARECYDRLQKMFADVVEKPLPQNPIEQLWLSISAVFESWHSPRAVEYRRIHRIPSDWGTACTVQAMVFGNMGKESATGVAFTRDPSTGEKKFFGEFLVNAQGEDVVAGIRTPQSLSEMEPLFPESYQDLVSVYQKLENHYRDMQDMEFTIQKGKLWMLQTRRGKRTARSAVKIAVDMVAEGLISKEEAILRMEPSQVDQLLHPMLSPRVKKNSVARGLPASPGAAVGRVVFNAEDAVAWAQKKEPVILVRDETSPDDIHGMHAAIGILTSRGGVTSHAAVVGRGMGKVCVVGCEKIRVDEKAKQFAVNGSIVKEGDWITLDGTSGDLFLEKLPTVAPEWTPEFKTLLNWANDFRKLKVRANADTPADARQALEFGAEGVGLCRTEHMFFAKERLPVMQEMILAQSSSERCCALERLKPMQQKDFEEIFRVMKNLPVTIRLLDPPLHEFLPSNEELKETNPMLGFRGCRLGILYPEIYEMQISAIMEAACKVQKEGISVHPEIEIPLVGLQGEMKQLREKIEAICKNILKASGESIAYKIGSMIEVPRAALRADGLAPLCDFFSFGTNDLTQMTMGISRDDGFKFLPHYEKFGLVKTDPFQTIDFEGVGELMKICVAKARKIKPKMEIGICGEHGGDPESIYFCHQIGLDYVSCSPFRIPVAILSAARAVLLLSI